MSLIDTLLTIFRSLLSRGATVSTPPTTTAPAPVTADDGQVWGAVQIDGIYSRYQAADPTACRAYNQIDPDTYPKIWIPVTGTALGRVVFGLKVDDRMPRYDEYEIAGAMFRALGQSEVIVLDYPKYSAYRTAGPHTLTVLWGHGDGRNVEWIGERSFAIEVVKE